ncbi:hypothetical protein L195_g063181, partial [Trifolium pratense]
MGSCCSKPKEKTNDDDNKNKLKSDFASKIKEIKNEGVLIAEARKLTRCHSTG